VLGPLRPYVASGFRLNVQFFANGGVAPLARRLLPPRHRLARLAAKPSAVLQHPHAIALADHAPRLHRRIGTRAGEVAEITEIFVSTTPDDLLERAINEERFDGQPLTRTLSFAPTRRPPDEKIAQEIVDIQLSSICLAGLEVRLAWR
jgi:hypothetical protein